jgi:D-3-phosphoglycerate dehydrogenase
MNTLIAESSEYSSKAITLYNRLGKVISADLKSRAELLLNVKDVEILIIRLHFHIDREIIDSAPKLKYIVSPTTGTDHIDIEYAASKNIKVITLKGESAFLDSIPSTAEHTIALLLALMRNIPASVKHTLEGNWNRNLFMGHNLKHQKIGIIGLGRVGKQVAGIYRAFGMEVSYYDPYVSNESYTRVYSLKKLLSQNDIISIHVPLNDETQYLLDKEILHAVQPHAYIINTSRAAIWDESIIIDMIHNNKIAGVATDVISNEQNTSLFSIHPMIKCATRYPEKLLITPHIAGATFESMRMTEEFVAEKLANLINEKV